MLSNQTSKLPRRRALEPVVAGRPAVPADIAEVIPVLRPRLPRAAELMPYLNRIDQSQCYSNHGPLVLELESRLAAHLALPRGCLASASSGTAALVGAILAVAGRARAPRTLALMPAYTFVGTASAAEQCGFTPYLADMDGATWMLDPERVEALPALAQVGVVMVVSPFGRPVPQAPWLAFQQRTGIPVVIDGAASFEGVAAAPADYIGAIPVALSFHATKSFATGEGGAVVSRDQDLVHRAMQAMNFGFSGDRNSRCAAINGKLSEYHAAVGLAELDGWEDKRDGLYAVRDFYRDLLEPHGIAGRFYGAPDLAGCYGLFLCADADENERVQASLRRYRVDFRLWYGKGLHHQDYYLDLPHAPLDVTDDMAPRLLGLPMGRNLDATMVARVAAALVSGVFE